MEKKIAVIGLGIYGREVALNLTARGLSILAVDSNPALVEGIKDNVARALIMDATDDQALIDAGIDQMDTVVNAIGSQFLQNSILVTALLAQVGVAHIVGRATSVLHERILRQVGATAIINPERETAARTAREIARPGLGDVLELTEGVCVAEVPAPAEVLGATLAEVDPVKRWGVAVAGIQRVPLAEKIVENDEAVPDLEALDGKEARRMIFDLDPARDTVLENDILVVIGPEDRIDQLTRRR